MYCDQEDKQILIRSSGRPSEVIFMLRCDERKSKKKKSDPGRGRGKHVQRLWGRKQLTYFSLTLVSLYETLFVSFSLFLSFFLKYLYFSSGWQCTQLKIFFSSLICILHWRCHTALINKVWAVRILVKAFIFLIQALLLSFFAHYSSLSWKHMRWLEM